MPKKYVAFIEGGHAGLYKGEATPSRTPGKETPYIKSLGRRIQEEEFNEPTAAFLMAELKRAGVDVYDVAPGAEDVPLNKRTDFANKIYWQYCSKYGKDNVVAIYISIHFNAYDGKFDGNDPSGFSVHVYPGSKSGRELGQSILNELKNGTKQINRGLKENDFHVVRESAMPAVLTENGFMDHPREALLMVNASFQKEVAVETAKGALKYMGLPYVAPPKPKPVAKKGLYKVQVGAFKNRIYAQNLEKELRAEGFKDTFIKIEGGFNKVQVGAFSVKANAEALEAKIKKAGFKSTFIRYE